MSESNFHSPDLPACPRCGRPVPARTSMALCPVCLMKEGLDTETGVGHATRELDGSKPRPLPNQAEIARLFPQYEIVECLGRGGMGVVYKARQKSLDRLVALKILAPEREKDPEFADRFAREAKTLAQLNHPNIVTVFEFGESHGMFFLAMEFVDGVNLRHLIAERTLSPEEAVAIVPSICDALQYAHDKGVVHRDIKPENLLLDREGRIKIADYGIARIMERERGAGETPDGTAEIAGTPKYMAPEQKDAPAEVDHRADIYSLGLVFYELLTGELPRGDFAPPSSRGSSLRIDVRLDEVVLRALEAAPEHRYQQASEIRTDIETIAAGPASNFRRKEDGRHRAFPLSRSAGALALLAVAVLAAVLIGTTRKENKPQEQEPVLTGPPAVEMEEDSGIEKNAIRFVRIPAGRFQMGSPPNEPGRQNSEGPRHTVTISRAFHLAQTPVTWNQWVEVRVWASANGYTDLPVAQKGSHGDERNSGDDPVTMISWWDAIHWLNARSEMEDRTPVYYSSPEFEEENVLRSGQPRPYADWSADGYRLPTEAEWEYACRAGTDTAFHTGDILHPGEDPLEPNLDKAGWYAGNSEGTTHPVAQKEPNAWGLYDMHGGVWEWCWNYADDYRNGEKTDPRGPATGQNRVRRGGSWVHEANHARAAFRVYSGPFNRFNYVGLRPARNAGPDDESIRNANLDTVEKTADTDERTPPIPSGARSEEYLTVNRPALFTIIPENHNRTVRVHVAIEGRLDGKANIAGRLATEDVEVHLSEELKAGESLNFEYIPMNATEGKLRIRYWFSD